MMAVEIRMNAFGPMRHSTLTFYEPALSARNWVAEHHANSLGGILADQGSL